ncbi:hypothetical protein JTE90_003856 [Oedothorax gibbosus]|uniref:Uncharacterized protein n=1 Tax=Oedothorax gibbosus TaxID=931172 RepID=A0AAV6UH39_9ARAC|nr:hypothetical protein JTE90_003856 [Oedothorax gibbosus]
MKRKGKKPRMFLKTHSKVHILKSQSSSRIKRNLVTAVHSKVFKDRNRNKKWYYLSKVKWRTVLNVLGFFGIIVGCVYQCGLFLSLYLDYPTTVEFNVANEATLDFPAVTVCNSNPVRYKLWCAEDASVCIRKPNETMEDIRIRHADLYDALSREHRIQLGNQFDDFLLYAEYEDKSVKNDFTQYYDYEFTNCYTFNSVWGNQSTPVKSAFLFNPVTGTSSELIMCVNIDVSNYGNLTGTVVGRVRLTIHANDIVPNPTYDAATLEAGEFYSYAVQKVTTELLERPYQTSCRNYEKEKEIRTGARMSQKNCLLECFKNETEKMCGCTYRRLSLMYNAAPCELRPQKHCLEVVEEQVFELCNPQCPMGCKKIEFQFVATDSEPLREVRWL